MKNFMKKIIVGLSVFVFLLSANAVSAAWNTFPSDCPLPLSIGNYTTGYGIQDGTNGCWTKTSTPANPGDTINVAVYYDNTNTTNANSSIIRLTQTPAGSMSTTNSTYTFSGSLTSSAGNLNLSQVTANLTSAQSLTFGQAKWYKAGSSSATPLPSGQTGYEAFSGGLNLGTIAKDDWGTVLFAFSVGTVVDPQTCTDPTATNYGGPLPCSYYTQTCTISNFTANGSTGSVTMSSGNSLNLVWGTTGCTSANISGPNGTISTSLNNSMTVYPTTSGNYTITAYGPNGSAPSRSIYVNITDNQNNCYINNFTANGSTTAYVSSGDAVNIVWSTTGCTSANVSGPNLYSSSLNNSRTVYPTSSGTYILNAYGNNGVNQTRTVYINVNDVPVNNCYINNFTGNGSTSVSIQQGAPLNLVWNTTGCNSVSVSGPGISSNILTGAQTIYPTNNAVYTITGYGSNGSAPSRSVYVTVNPIVIVTNSCAITTVATNIGQNSATLNGLLTGSTGASYFEYGTSINLGMQTISRTGTGSYTEVISGLASNTFYYFRLVSQCSGGLSYGKIEVFQTQGIKTVRPIIIQGTTVIGTQSPIMLKIENRYQYIGIGDTVDYTVTYKNIGKSRLTKPVLQVVIPNGITLTNSSAGTYQVDTNTLTVQLQDLNPGDEGVVYLQGFVTSIDSSTAQIVTTAILVYTSPNGAQENAIAYVLNSPRQVLNTLGASAFWSGLASIGLVGWLLILILILLIILLTRRYYNNNKVVHTTTPGGSHTTTTTHY